MRRDELPMEQMPVTRSLARWRTVTRQKRLRTTMTCIGLMRYVLMTAAALLMFFIPGSPVTTVQAQGGLQVIASGLDNPRGLTFGADGALYVAEAGRGGTSALCAPDPGTGANRCYGATGAVTRITGIGAQQRVVTGLPSIAPAGGD